MIQVSSESLFKIFKSKNNDFPFQRSSSGSSGFTFLPKNIQFPWVVKWQNPIQAEIEYICTEFFRRSFTHLSVPKIIYKISNSEKNEMLNYFRNQGISSQHIPILIEYKTGNNLKQVFQNKNMNFESIHEMSQFFYNFGEISGYDYLIANCDRFIPNELSEELKNEFSVNGGNILVEIDQNQISSENDLHDMSPWL